MTDERRPPRGATQTVALGVPVPPRPTAVLSPGSTVADRYQVRGVLGSGGFAVVYLALDRESGHEVALKVLHPERVDGASLGRLRREAEIANRAESPHLVRVHDVGLDGDTPYLALERIHGRSLAQRLDGELLALEEVLTLARGILAGLDTLHRQGVLHRDVKPGNVLLGDDGRVMLVDYGLSLSEQHSAETRATAAEAVIGTVEYLSPEQALAEEVDPRSDLYSFGVVLFEMLTGRLPHSARSALGTLVAHIQQPAPDVRSLRPQVPPWLAAVVARLLAKRPEDRYPSAAAVMEDLERRRASGGRPRRQRRRWWRPGLAAALVAVLAAGGLWWLAARPGRPTLSHVRQSGDSLQGIGQRGEVLWTLPHTHGRLLPARLKPGEPRRLVGFPHSAQHNATAQPVPLSVLDPLTGRVVRRVEMRFSTDLYPGMSNRFSARPHVLDLDGDGYDEVVVEYMHKPYWPSYTVLYEPRVERTRLVLAASGHHRLVGPVDLDGDGRLDLVFAGKANKMGWYSAAAGLVLDPPVNTEPVQAGRTAFTPDHAVNGNHHLQPLWYVLLARDVNSEPDQVRIDAAGRRLLFPAFVGPGVELTFDGFRAGAGPPMGAAAANTLRNEAYLHLREARRLSTVGHTAGAVAETRQALRRAERIGDPLLAEWSRRSEAIVLARGGRRAQAEVLFRRLAETSAHRAEIAFDAASAFHLGDDPERAVTWYRRGLGPGGTTEVGRGRYEYLHGLVFALLELGRWDEALAETVRYRTTVHSTRLAWLQAYLRWRRGADLEVDLEHRDLHCGTGTLGRVDFDAYLTCELELAEGADPRTLLRRVEAEVERSSETVPALLALRALLLHRLGRRDEAATAARRAWERTQRERADNLYARALAGLVAERHAVVTGRHPAGVGG